MGGLLVTRKFEITGRRVTHPIQVNTGRSRRTKELVTLDYVLRLFHRRRNESPCDSSNKRYQQLSISTFNFPFSSRTADLPVEGKLDVMTEIKPLDSRKARATHTFLVKFVVLEIFDVLTSPFARSAKKGRCYTSSTSTGGQTPPRRSEPHFVSL